MTQQENSSLVKAIEIVKKGGIAIFPTDTAFGIGCRIDNKKAVERLFQIKQRSENQAVPMLVSSSKMAEEYVAKISPEVLKLMQLYWPGALTIVLPANRWKVHDPVSDSRHTVGVRMPNHPVALQLIEGVGVPIIGTSANLHGGATPYRFEDLDSRLTAQVDVVLQGVCNVGQASTIIDCFVKPWKIIRQGTVQVPL